MKVTTLLKLYIVTMVVALIFLLAACRELTSGQVIDKHFTEGYYTTGMVKVGKNSWIPRTYYHSATYGLHIKGYNKKGEQITEWWYVSSGNFQRYGIGSFIKDTSTNW